MNFMKILPLSKVRMNVLFEIYAEGSSYLRSISKNLDLNSSLAHRVLGKLTEAGFLMKEKKGQEVMYELSNNRDIGLILQLLEEYHLEKVLEKQEKLNVMLKLLLVNKEIMDSSSKIFLFGSYVLGDVKKESDIDICFVNEDRKLVGKVCREISQLLGVEVSPLIYSKKSFRTDLRGKEALLSSIYNNVRNRVIIK